MSLDEILFVILGIVAVGSALYAVVTRYLLHAIVALGAFLTAVAGEFLLLAADFVAVIQIFVYVGGVLVLILFALMLSVSGQRRPRAPSDYSALAAVVSYAMGAGLIWASISAEFPAAEGVPEDSVPFLGEAFLGSQLLGFELIGVILLAALVAALVIARGDQQ